MKKFLFSKILMIFVGLSFCAEVQAQMTAVDSIFSAEMQILDLVAKKTADSLLLEMMKPKDNILRWPMPSQWEIEGNPELSTDLDPTTSTKRDTCEEVYQKKWIHANTTIDFEGEPFYGMGWAETGQIGGKEMKRKERVEFYIFCETGDYFRITRDKKTLFTLKLSWGQKFYGNGYFRNQSTKFLILNADGSKLCYQIAIDEKTGWLAIRNTEADGSWQKLWRKLE
jgi:hypothetical protein